MQLVPAGTPASFAASFNASDLSVAMSVYDDTGANPVLLLSPFSMSYVAANTYRGKFTPANGKTYIILMAVYTDNTFTTLNASFQVQSQSVLAQYLSSPPSEVVGYVDDSETVTGVVNC